MIKFARWFAGSALLLVGAPLISMAQQAKSAPVDDLVKSIGLVKPPVASAPDFNLLDINGSPVGLSGYRGRFVLLNFWATWCAPCREEMPSMEQLSRNVGGPGFAVLAVNQRENAAVIAKFMKTHGLNFTTPLDTTARVAGYYRVYGIPVSYLIDGNGQILGMKSGSMDWAAPAVVNLLRKLIGDRGSDASGSMALEPAKPLPGALRAKSDGILIHSQQDASSEGVGKTSRTDDMIPLGKVSGAGEFWYMVKTKSGAIGWIRGGDVEDLGARK